MHFYTSQPLTAPCVPRTRLTTTLRCLATRSIRCLTLGLFLLSPALGSAEEIVVGQTGSLVNPLIAPITREYNAGIQLAIERANALGGVGGKRIRLAFREDGFDAARTVRVVDELVDQEHIVALAGVMGTQPVMKLADEKTLEKHRLASIGPLTGLQSVLAKPQVFPVRGSYEDEVRAMLVHSANLGRRKVLFLYYKAGVGPTLAPLVAAMANQAGVTLSGTIGFAVTPANQQAAVRSALESNRQQPDSIILLAIGPAHTEAVKVLRARFGSGMPIYSLGQVNPDALIKEVGRDAARGIMLTQVMPMPGSVNLRISRDFDEDRRRFAPEAPPSYMFMEGYVCGRLVVELLRRSKSVSREAVLAAAERAGVLDIGGYRVEYHATTRRSVNPIELTMISAAGTLIR